MDFQHGCLSLGEFCLDLIVVWRSAAVPAEGVHRLLCAAAHRQETRRVFARDKAETHEPGGNDLDAERDLPDLGRVGRRVDGNAVFQSVRQQHTSGHPDLEETGDPSSNVFRCNLRRISRSHRRNRSNAQSADDTAGIDVAQSADELVLGHGREDGAEDEDERADDQSPLSAKVSCQEHMRSVVLSRKVHLPESGAEKAAPKNAPPCSTETIFAERSFALAARYQCHSRN